MIELEKAGNDMKKMIRYLLAYPETPPLELLEKYTGNLEVEQSVSYGNLLIYPIHYEIELQKRNAKLKKLIRQASGQYAGEREE